MARFIHRLTAVKVPAIRTPGYYADGGNLYLRVAPGGSKSWAFRFTLGGKSRDAGLGSFPTITLAKAREEAERFRRLVANGIDPIDNRRNERDAAVRESTNAITFEDCARTYITSHELSWRNLKHRAQWTSTFDTYVYPIAGKLPVRAIDTAIVMSVLKPIWNAKPETASRVRGRIEAVLSWAQVQGYRESENPARWRGHLDQLLPAKRKVRRVTHHSALPYAEVGMFVAELRQQETVAARALEFLILTAARSGETLNATWDEIDVEGRLWTVPAPRMKAHREHRVPLCGRATGIINEMAGLRRGEFIFPGVKPGRPLSKTALAMVLRRLGYRSTTVHGLRSSFRDWAAEQTVFSGDVAEMALAHTIPGAVERAYRRGDLLEQRRRLMEAWGGYCDSPRHLKCVA